MDQSFTIVRARKCHLYGAVALSEAPLSAKVKMQHPPLTSDIFQRSAGISSSYATVPTMSRLLFVAIPPLAGDTVWLGSPMRKRRRTRAPRCEQSSSSPPTNCEISRVVILPSAPGHVATATRRSARVSILTDFSSNPLAAISDRVADPLSAVMLVVAAALGALVTGVAAARSPLPAPVGPALKAAAQAEEDGRVDVLALPSAPSQIGGPTPGENALWLNMSLRTLWRLFRKSTNSLTKDVLQPVLDNMELPPMVQSVTITSLTLGESPALVRKIQRLPSRSLSEVQYKFGLRLIGDKEGRIEMDVAVRIPGTERQITVPISVSSLDIEAKVWLGFTLVPYKPWIRFAQWALVRMPIVRLRMQVAKFLPVSTIPFLSTVLNKILTKDVPKEFLFPKTQFIDLMDKEETNVMLERGLLAARGVRTRPDAFAVEELRKQFPHLVNLFDVLDVNDDGILSPNELSNGLVEWGYASEADRNSIMNLLDINNDGRVDLEEFVSVWGDLKNVFVPRRFRGVLTGLLLRAEGLRTPTLGGTDPYVALQVESQSMVSKRNRATSKTGIGRGTAVWNEGWELFVQQPKTAVLRIQVLEGCYLTYYRQYIAPPVQPTTHSGSGVAFSPVEQANRLKKIIGYGSIPVSDIGSTGRSFWIDLTTGGGRVKMDIQFNEFVDPKIL